MSTGVMLEMAVKLVVLIGVVMQHQTSRRRVDDDLLDPRNHRKRPFHLFEQFGIALCRGYLHADATGHLMRNLQFYVGHHRSQISTQDRGLNRN